MATESNKSEIIYLPDGSAITPNIRLAAQVSAELMKEVKEKGWSITPNQIRAAVAKKFKLFNLS